MAKKDIKLLRKPYTHQEIVDGANVDSTRYSLQISKVPVGTTKSLSKVTFKAEDGKYFSTLPTLVSNSNNVFLVKHTEKKSKNKVIECVYILKYKNVGDGITPDISFEYEAVKFNETWSRTPIITGLKVSKSTIKNTGGRIKITVNGDKGAKYAIAINESQLNTDNTIDHASDVSILKPGQWNKEINFQGQLDFKVIEGTLDRSGKKVITYSLPSSLVKSTQNTHTSSSTKAMRLQSIRGVKVGDRIKSPSILKSSNISVETIVNEKFGQITATGNVTLSSTGTSVLFEREKIFTVNLIKENYSELPTKSSCVIRQFHDPILTINYNVGGSTTITHVNGVATSAGAGIDQEAFIVGKAESSSYGISKTKLNYNKNYNSSVLDVDLTLTRGSNFTTFSNPPDIENPREDINGGFTMPITDAFNNTYRMYICGLSTSALPNTTIHLYFKIKVTSWGRRDQVLNFDIDSLFN